MEKKEEFWNWILDIANDEENFKEIDRGIVGYADLEIILPTYMLNCLEKIAKEEGITIRELCLNIFKEGLMLEKIIDTELNTK